MYPPLMPQTMDGQENDQQIGLNNDDQCPTEPFIGPLTSLGNFSPLDSESSSDDEEMSGLGNAPLSDPQIFYGHLQSQLMSHLTLPSPLFAPPETPLSFTGLTNLQAILNAPIPLPEFPSINSTPIHSAQAMTIESGPLTSVTANHVVNLPDGSIQELSGQAEDWFPALDDNTRNYDVCDWIDKWLMRGSLSQANGGMLNREAHLVRQSKRPSTVMAHQVSKDRYDYQGINWANIGTTRDTARRVRSVLFSNFGEKVDSPQSLRSSPQFFKFCRTDTRHQPAITHFQLRNLIAAPSSGDIYYANRARVLHTNASRKSVDCVMDFEKGPNYQFRITSLAAVGTVLVAGGFHGEYAMSNLASEFDTKPISGAVSSAHDGITNHIHIAPSRSSGLPLSIFSSNDCKVRILDCATNRFIQEARYDYAINCTATSPCGRLRIVTGDSHSSLITNANSGETIASLTNHKDHIFACAWADDGIHVATGAQDSQVVVYDARRWDQPLAKIASDLACPRSLRFSPLGSGRRLLFSAEANDFVNVIDGITFSQKQSLDFFGGVAGIAIPPCGSSLFVANCDSKFGGIMEYERCGVNEWFHDDYNSNSSFSTMRDEYHDFYDRSYQPTLKSWDWISENSLSYHGQPFATSTAPQRARNGLGLSDIVF